MNQIKKVLYTTLLLLLASVVLNANSNNKIKIYTENYPPYNMKVAGKLTGKSVDVLDAIFNQMNSKQTLNDVKLTNWSRAYTLALKVPNSMVFSTARTNEREDLFKWVGPISTTKSAVIALKSKNIVINTISDFNNYKIGAVLKDVSEQLLLQKGINKQSIQHVNGEDAIEITFTKMEKNRIDMFAYDPAIAFKGAKLAGFDVDKYEIIYELSIANLSFAFNKNTDDKIIQKWQKALDEIKQNGTYDAIMNKYK
jgi:polar amino acid transport system substrate-binding protein